MRIQTDIPAAPAAVPPWLTFVSRADNDFALLRLMVINPINGAISTMLEEPIEVEPVDFSPRASNLHIGLD
jgi:hypothetical protein